MSATQSREEKQEGFTDGEGGLAPLTWGRMKIARAAITSGEIDENDLPDVAAVLYLETFAKLRTYPRAPQKFVAACCSFARGHLASRVVECGMALDRDMGSIKASEIKPVDEGPEKSPPPREAAVEHLPGPIS